MSNAVHTSLNTSFFAEPNGRFEKQIDDIMFTISKIRSYVLHFLQYTYSGCQVKLFTWSIMTFPWLPCFNHKVDGCYQLHIFSIWGSNLLLSLLLPITSSCEQWNALMFFLLRCIWLETVAHWLDHSSHLSDPTFLELGDCPTSWECVLLFVHPDEILYTVRTFTRTGTCSPTPVWPSPISSIL